jgi:16S rRNA (guanine966-N2)-methyltransferase
MPRKNRMGPRPDRFATAKNAGVAPPQSPGPAGRADGPGEVRIVGGAWRGRKLRFPVAAGLRPTPDRVRETLFNWLQFEIPGTHCLDLFAGSGALGLEALSRGASSVTFVEADAKAAGALQAALHQFGGAGRATVESGDAFALLARPPPAAFDVVFLDPPYDRRWLGRACEALEQGGWLAPGAWIYLEDAASHGEPALPPGWTLHRSKRAGDVGYHLARRGAPH